MHILAALLPGVLPLVLCILALCETDEAVLGIFLLWPLTIVPPALSVLSLLVLGLRMASPEPEEG